MAGKLSSCMNKSGAEHNAQNERKPRYCREDQVAKPIHKTGFLSSFAGEKKAEKKTQDRCPLEGECAGEPVNYISIAGGQSQIGGGGNENAGIDLPTMQKVEDQDADNRQKRHSEGKKSDQDHGEGEKNDSQAVKGGFRPLRDFQTHGQIVRFRTGDDYVIPGRVSGRVGVQKIHGCDPVARQGYQEFRAHQYCQRDWPGKCAVKPCRRRDPVQKEIPQKTDDLGQIRR